MKPSLTILRKCRVLVVGMVLFAAVPVMSVQQSPELQVTSDDVSVSQSCRIVIPPGTVIEDKNNNGVIHVIASRIEIEFAEGSVLCGSPPDRRPNEYAGYGIRIEGQTHVAIRGARISGFWTALWATGADGLTLGGIDASDNRRAYLRSTPVAEDSSDWLYPHDNDDNEWLRRYGAAIYVEDANHVTVRCCTVRHGQNALCLDRVDDSEVYDNDFSFNSGWGIAMWRCSRNVISRNACDFCVRGYSHGVYNRGQDSAGILLFEQNNKNTVAENSATHSGDGFFGFAGREALGQTGNHPVGWHKRRGNNGNLLIGNDFSYAPAHGIEMTFSFGNIFYGNRLVENAICGIWGGYSQDTLIARNNIEGNGQMAYGLERGGVNIEHGRANRIVENAFANNQCGVHLWWSDPGDLANTPWARANGTESRDNRIVRNTFTGDALAYHFRGSSQVTLGRDVFTDVKEQMRKDETVTIQDAFDAEVGPVTKPEYPVRGVTRPVGARRHLCGRHNIIMTPWGPWDHESPLIRVVRDDGDSVRYSLHKVPRAAQITVEGYDVQGELSWPQDPDQPGTYTVSAAKPGVHPYRIQVRAGDFAEQLHGTLISAVWDVTFFKWTDDTDPRKDIASWRKLAHAGSSVSARVKRLVFSYAWGGPGEQELSEAVTAAQLGGDHFGMIATTRMPLAAGAWEFATLSDDGVRVTVDGRTIIDNWTWHGPTRDSSLLHLNEDKTVEIVVEHFEIDGYAALELSISGRL